MTRKVEELPGIQGTGYAPDTGTLYVDVVRFMGGRPALFTQELKEDAVLTAWRLVRREMPELQIRYLIVKGLAK